MGYTVTYGPMPEYMKPLAPNIYAAKPKISGRPGSSLYQIELWNGGRGGEYLYRYGSWDECRDRAQWFLNSLKA